MHVFTFCLKLLIYYQEMDAYVQLSLKHDAQRVLTNNGERSIESEANQDTKRSTVCNVTLCRIQHSRLGCLSSVDRLVCTLRSLDSTHWLKTWRTCLGKGLSGFHMSLRNNSLLTETQKVSVMLRSAVGRGAHRFLKRTAL